MKYLSSANNANFDNNELMQFTKMRVSESVSAVERHFFQFNEKFHAAPTIFNIIRQMSEVFTLVKKELANLGLLDLPKFTDVTIPQSNNSNVQRRERDTDDSQTISDKDSLQARKRR